MNPQIRDCRTSSSSPNSRFSIQNALRTRLSHSPSRDCHKTSHSLQYFHWLMPLMGALDRARLELPNPIIRSSSQFPMCAIIPPRARFTRNTFRVNPLQSASIPRVSSLRPLPAIDLGTATKGTSPNSAPAPVKKIHHVLFSTRANRNISISRRVSNNRRENLACKSDSCCTAVPKPNIRGGISSTCNSNIHSP